MKLQGYFRTEFRIFFGFGFQKKNKKQTMVNGDLGLSLNSGERLMEWGKTRTKIPDGAASQVGPFPHSMAM